MAIDYFKQYDSPSNNAAEDEEIKRLTRPAPPPKPQQPSENIRLSQNRQAVVMPDNFKIRTRTDTDLPHFRVGNVYRDASGLHTGRYVTQKDFEEGQAQVDAYKRAHPQVEGRVTTNRYRGDSWNRPPQTSVPSASAPRQGAAQFRQAAQSPAQSPAAQGGGIDLAATNARAKAMRQQAADQEAQGREKMDGLMGQALTTLLGEWRNNGTNEMADPMGSQKAVPLYDNNGRIKGYGPALGAEGQMYRVAHLEPATLRQLNEQRQSFGLRDTDKVIGMMAVGNADADGKTGTPSFYLRYRDANGRVHTRVATYEQAARQYAMAHMKANGSTDAAYDLANNETWNDPLRYKGTAGYLSSQAKIDATRTQNEAAALKNDLTRQQMEQGKAKFEQEQQALAEARKNKPIADARAEVDRLDKLVAAEKDEAAKQNWISQANAARKVLADRQAEARLADITDATEEGASPDNMPQFVKTNGKLVLRDGYIAKKMQNGKTTFVLKPGFVLGEYGIPVQKPQRPGTPQAAQGTSEASPTKPGEAAGAPIAQTKSASPEQQYAKDYNAKVVAFTKAGGEHSTESGGRTNIKIANWHYLSEADRRKMPETPRDLSDDVVSMQKKANEAKAEFDKKVKAEEERLRKEVATRKRSRNWTPQRRDEYVARRLRKWRDANDPAIVIPRKSEQAARVAMGGAM